MATNNVTKVAVPEGYVLAKKSEIQTLQRLVTSVENINSNRQRLEHSINDIINSNSRSYAHNLRDKDDLIAKFESTCQHSTLRSKIEDVKSNCTKTLKNNLKDIQRKQKLSNKALKERFEAGAGKLKQCYEDELTKNFGNQTSLNNSLPVEQYACEELVKTYRECLKSQLLPEMQKMYKDHCQKIDGALRDWVRQYQAVATKDSQLSPAINEKINNLQRRLTQMSQNTPSLERKIDETLQRMTRDIGQLQVEKGEVEVAPSHEDIVEGCLERSDFQGALNSALVAMDLNLLMSTCTRMSVDDVFGDEIPDQPILLALLNQLPYNLHQDLEVKSRYLMEAVQALDLTHQVIANNSETVFRELGKLLEHIDTTRQQITPRQYNQHLKQLRWATQQIIRQLEE